MIKKNMTRGVSAGALAVLASACGHLPIAEPAFDAMAAKRAGMPNDWTVAPMTGDATAIIANQLVGHVDIAGSFLDRFQLSLTLPITLVETGSDQASIRSWIGRGHQQAV